MAGTSFLIGSSLLQGKNIKSSNKLVILHTNDTHSRLDPFPEGHKLENKGGISTRASIINKIRQENENVLLLDAGDILQGTPYFNIFKGEVEILAMNHLKYDAATIGNHEFDAGMDRLSELIEMASFPFIISNYNFTGTPLDTKIHKNLIIRKGTFKIGIYGLGIDPKGLIPSVNIGNTTYSEPLETALYQESYLKKERHCDLIICLSHLGYSYETKKISDIKIAEKTHFTDLIIGGHTHTFLNQAVTIQNANNKSCYIVQAGYGGANIGRIDMLRGVKNHANFFKNGA